jgi:hypothetical protein
MEKRKIIFIAPEFYDYHKIITEKLRELFGETFFFPERKTNGLYTILNNIHPKLINLYQQIYFFFIWQQIKKEENITNLFVIRGYKMPFSFIKKLKKKFPNIRTTMYQWDSIKNNSYEYLIPCFDKTYTFDYKDFEQRKDLKFLQLFYTDDIKKIRDTKVSTLYDFFLLNSFSMERYKAITKVLDYCKEKNLTVKQFCYIPFRTFFKYKYLLRIPLDKSLLSFAPMSRQEYIDSLSKCDIVVDVNHSTQTGLSMRVTETYGAGKKILTTNKSIQKDPLYNKTWAQTFDLNDIELLPFEKQEKNSVADELYIDNWLKTILG